MWDACTSHVGPKKFDQVGRGGQGRSKYYPEWASFLASEPSRGPLNGSRTPEMDSNQSGAVGGIIWGPFPGCQNVSFYAQLFLDLSIFYRHITCDTHLHKVSSHDGLRLVKVLILTRFRSSPPPSSSHAAARHSRAPQRPYDVQSKASLVQIQWRIFTNVHSGKATPSSL